MEICWCMDREIHGWGRTKMQFVYSVILAEFCLALSMGSPTFLLLTHEKRVPWRFSCSYRSCWEPKSTLSIWLWFKNWKRIIPWWFYHIHNKIFYLKNSAFWVGFGWLYVWVSWHINLWRLFNVKSIFIQIISSISNNSV